MYQRFGLGIDTGSGLVHHQDFRLEYQRARECEQLALSTGKIAATLPYVRMITVEVQPTRKLAPEAIAGPRYNEKAMRWVDR